MEVTIPRVPQPTRRPQPVSRVRALVGDTVALTFGTLSSRLLGILLLPLYTYTLSSDEFGRVDFVLTSLELTVPLLYLAISEGVLRYAMRPDERRADVLRTALVFVALCSGAAILCAGPASLAMGSPAALMIAAVIAAQATFAVLGAWARAIGHVRSYTLAGAIQALVLGVSNAVLLAGLGLGTDGFILSLLAANLAGTFTLLARLPWQPALTAASFDRDLLHRLLVFSVPLVPNMVMWWLTNISGRYFLVYFDGLDAVGMFGVASRIPGFVVLATTVFSQAWQLAANKSIDAEDQDRAAFYTAIFRHYAGSRSHRSRYSPCRIEATNGFSSGSCVL